MAPSGRAVFDFVLGAGPGSGSYVRNLVFVQPKKGAQSVDADCRQRQQFGVFAGEAGETLVYATAMNMLNIPFKDCFTVNTAWVVRPAPGGGCTWSVYLKVNFIRGCMVGGIIRATTTNSNKEFFRTYAQSATEAIAAGGPPPAPPPTAADASASASAAAAAAPAAPKSQAHRAGSGAAMPMERQLQVFLLFLLLLVCLVHQVVLRRDVAHVRDMFALVTAGKR